MNVATLSRFKVRGYKLKSIQHQVSTVNVCNSEQGSQVTPKQGQMP